MAAGSERDAAGTMTPPNCGCGDGRHGVIPQSFSLGRAAYQANISQAVGLIRAQRRLRCAPPETSPHSREFGSTTIRKPESAFHRFHRRCLISAIVRVFYI